MTPNLNGLDLNSFSIRVRFKADGYDQMPVFVGGASSRWLLFYLEVDGQISLQFNNWRDRAECDGKYLPGQWHEATVSYDGSVAQLYLDGAVACRAPVLFEHLDDFQILTADMSSGKTFQGVMADLQIYNRPITALPPAFEPIALYPLGHNGEDRMGRYGPMSLVNAPFQDGGVYSNGIYDNDNPDTGCRIITPQLDGLSLNSFSIAVRFKALEYGYMPVFVGGTISRWTGFYLNEDGRISMKYNNSQRAECRATYAPGQWHDGMITYDGAVGRLYVDGVLACDAEFVIKHRDDRTIGTTDYSNARVFNGVIAELTVYDRAIVPRD
jgi:hypothetical protein